MITYMNPAIFPADEITETMNRPALLGQQLDLDGRLHDLAPAAETLRLFDSAPQIRGQIALETDPLTIADVRAVECPTCHAPAGRPCKRPSGHRAASPHAGRVKIAETNR